MSLPSSFFKSDVSMPKILVKKLNDLNSYVGPSVVTDTFMPGYLTKNITYNPDKLLRYFFFQVATSVSANDLLTIKLVPPEALFDCGGHTVVVRIDNTSGKDLRLMVDYDGSQPINMYNSDIMSSSGTLFPAGKTVELVFTFWSRSEITFNGGMSV